jgi:hypothetical protein
LFIKVLSSFIESGENLLSAENNSFLNNGYDNEKANGNGYAQYHP